MKTSRTLSFVGAMLLFALLAPLPAAARPPLPPGPSPRSPRCSGRRRRRRRRRTSRRVATHLGARRRIARSHLRAPRNHRERRECRRARPRRRSSAARRQPAARDRPHGRRAAAHHSARYGVRVRLPRVLRARLVRARRVRAAGGRSGALGARRPSGISRSGRPRTSRRPRRRAAPSATCSSGAHSLSPFGAHVYPGDRQRRLHERPHRRLPDLRHGVQPVPAGDARRPHRPGDAVPDRLQPRLRADVAEHQGRPEHDRRLGARERPAGDASRSCSRRIPATRTARTIPTRGRTRPAQLNPVGGPENNPLPPACSPELLTTEPEQAGRPGRHAVSGEQARDHAVEPDRRAARRFVVEVDYTGRPGRAQRRRRHDRGLVQGRASRATPAASSRPSRWRPRTGCR